MKVIIENNGGVTIDFEGDLLVTSYKNISSHNLGEKLLTIRNAEIISSRVCGLQIPLRKYIIHCIKGCFKRYVK